MGGFRPMRICSNIVKLLELYLAPKLHDYGASRTLPNSSALSAELDARQQGHSSSVRWSNSATAARRFTCCRLICVQLTTQSTSSFCTGWCRKPVSGRRRRSSFGDSWQRTPKLGWRGDLSFL